MQLTRSYAKIDSWLIYASNIADTITLKKQKIKKQHMFKKFHIIVKCVANIS